MCVFLLSPLNNIRIIVHSNSALTRSKPSRVLCVYTPIVNPLQPHPLFAVHELPHNRAEQLVNVDFFFWGLDLEGNMLSNSMLFERHFSSCVGPLISGEALQGV